LGFLESSENPLHISMKGSIGPFPRIEACPDKVRDHRSLLDDGLKESSTMGKLNCLVHRAQSLRLSEPTELCLCEKEQGLDQKAIQAAMPRIRCHLLQQAKSLLHLAIRCGGRQAHSRHTDELEVPVQRAFDCVDQAPPRPRFGGSEVSVGQPSLPRSFASPMQIQARSQEAYRPFRGLPWPRRSSRMNAAPAQGSRGT
jgi:hypothetical protein